jgi:hypothetical protein
MKVSKGKTRTVLIFKNFVIKLPRIFLRQAFSILYLNAKRGRFWWVVTRNIKSDFSPWRYLFRGIASNWREYLYYKKLQSPFLQKTYVSIFGLLNMQKAGEELRIRDVDLWCQLVEMTNEEVWADGHTFSNTKNFCSENGRLKMVDYGNDRIYEVLKKHGDKIFKNFDFSYDWDERKKQLS